MQVAFFFSESNLICHTPDKLTNPGFFSHKQLAPGSSESSP